MCVKINELFNSLMILRKEKELSELSREETERMETEILKLKGRKREKAIKAYRKLLLSSADEPIYLMRSE